MLAVLGAVGYFVLPLPDYNREMTKFSFMLLVGLGSLAACSTDRTLAPKGTVLTDSRVTADVAVSSGDAVAWDFDRLEGIISTAGANLVLDKSARATPWQDPTCTYSTQPGRWNCTTKLDNGLMVSRSYSYADASGKAMRQYDELLTESVNYQSKSDGSLSRDSSYSALVHRSRTVVLSGLTGRESIRKWNVAGTSADTVTHRDDGSVRRYIGVTSDSLQNVVIPYPHTTISWPLSGTSVRTANFVVSTVGKSESRSVVRRAVVVFNGTSSASIQIGATKCVLHLDTHNVDGCTG